MESNDAPAQPQRAPKTFLQTLQDHHYGHTADEATNLLAECIAESARTGKATELTMKVKIKPESKAAGRYAVLVETTNKLPKREIEAAIMFVGPDGNLTNNDPRQQSLPGMRVVDKPVAPAVRADAEAPQAPAVRAV